jgi:hypothetical protein
MLGYVFVFRPDTGDGTIVTDGEAEVQFSSAGCETEFQGGDIGSFQLEQGSGVTRSAAGNIRIVERWSDRMATTCQPLLQQLHEVVQIDAANR